MMKNNMTIPQSGDTTRKMYHTPQLEEFGHVAELTRGSFSSMRDYDGSMTLNPKMGKGMGGGMGKHKGW